MNLPDTYSRRKRKSTEAVDVFQYEYVSEKLRNQFLHILEEARNRLGMGKYVSRNDFYERPVMNLRKEIGMKKLEKYGNGFAAEFHNWIGAETDVDVILDAFEFCAIQVHRYSRDRRAPVVLTMFCDEINARMREDGFGFQYSNLQIIKVSSQYLHSEVVVPALILLASPKFKSAEKEFRDAHQEFRAGNYEDCIHDCANAFESVLKVIGGEKGWAIKETDPASKLIAAAFENEIIPRYMQAEFSGLRTILETGVPTVRNKDAGHGAGVNPRKIPSHIAAFQLHQTAAAIILLVEAGKL